MTRLLAIGLVVLCLPLAAASAHVPKVEGVRVTVESQRLTIDWDLVAAANVTGYVVEVYTEGTLVRSYNATSGPITHFGQNHRAYAVVVRARDASGALGPPSDPVAAVATERNDLLYLALGLSVLWIGLWGHAVVLARAENRAKDRLDRIHEEKQRFGETK